MATALAAAVADDLGRESPTQEAQAAPAVAEPVTPAEAPEPAPGTPARAMEVVVPGDMQDPAERAGFFARAGEQIGAAWNLDTTAGAVSAYMDLETDDPAATVNQLADEELWGMLTPEEQAMPGLFTDVLTPADLARRREQIKQKQEFEDALGDGPLPAILASLVAQFGDPINYVPILGVGSKFVTGAKTGLQAAGRGALTVGASSMALTAAQETFIHQLQAGRTIGESVTAVALSGALGAGLGGPLGALARRGAVRRAQVREAQIDADLSVETMLDDAASATAVSEQNLRQLAVEGDEPPLAPGFVRLYHGGDLRSEGTLELNNFTSSRNLARQFGGDDILYYVDVPQDADLVSPIAVNDFKTTFSGRVDPDEFGGAQLMFDRRPPGRVIDEVLTEAPAAARAETPAEWADNYDRLSSEAKVDLARRAHSNGPVDAETTYYMRRAADEFEAEVETVRARIDELETDLAKLEELRDNAQDAGGRRSYSQRMRRRREQLDGLRDREVNLGAMAEDLRGLTDGGLGLVRGVAREVSDTINEIVEAGKPAVNRAETAAELAQMEARVRELEDAQAGKAETLGDGPRRDPKKMTINELFDEKPDVNRAAEIELEGTGKDLSAGAAPKFVGTTGLRYTPDDTRMYAKNWLARVAIAMHKKGEEQFGRFGAVLSAIPRRANMGLSNTGVKLLGSRFAHAREYAMRLGMANVAQVGPEAGRAFQSLVPVEALVRSRVQSYTLASRAIFNDGYRAYLRDVKAFNKKAKAQGQPLRPVRSANEFSKAVAEAIRRADIDPAAPKRNKFVTEVAGRYQREFFRPLLDEMRNAGLLADLPMDADIGYLHRVYDKRAIRQNIDAFRDIVATHIRQSPGAQAYTQDELAKIVSKTVANILAPTTDIGFPSYRVVAERGPLAQRELRIDDALLDNAIVKRPGGSQERVSFLMNDMNMLMERYIRTSVADLALTKEFGSPNPLAEMIDNLKDEGQRVIAEDLAAGRITKRQSELMKLEVEGEADALTTVYERVRGTSLTPLNPAYDVPRRVLHQLRNFTSMRLLGLSGWSSIPDAGRMTLTAGLTRTYGNLFREMQNGFRGVRMNRASMRKAAVGLDFELATTARALTDAGMNLQSRTGVERIGDKGAELMFTLNGQNLWNASTKRFIANAGGDEILEAADAVSRGQALTDVQRKRLARMAISEDDLRAIADQRDPDRWRTTQDGPAPAFGWFEVDGLKMLALDSWPNQELAQRVGQRLMVLADETIITPGALDSPGWTDSIGGRMFGHLKRFMFAATARTTLVGMQRQDADALFGLLQFLALGAAVTYLRLAIAGRANEFFEMDTEELVLNAVDRSGVVPFFFEVDNAMGSFSGTYAQPTRLLTGATPLRTSEASGAKYVLGAPGSTLIDAQQTINYLNQKDWEAEANDYRRVARLLPFQNFMGISALINTYLPAR